MSWSTEQRFLQGRAEAHGLEDFGFHRHPSHTSEQWSDDTTYKHCSWSTAQHAQKTGKTSDSIVIPAILLSGDPRRRRGRPCLRCRWPGSTPCEPSQRRSCPACPPSLLSGPAIGSGTPAFQGLSLDLEFKRSQRPSCLACPPSPVSGPAIGSGTPAI